MQSYLKEVAHEQFGVQLPVQRDVLKAVYRKAARRLHPDLSTLDKETAALRFRTMQEAYALLTAPNAQGVFVDSPTTILTTDGTALDELGLGLGPAKNGKECIDCKGAGYSKVKRRVVLWFPYEPCSICRLMGSTWGCQKCSHLLFTHADKVETIYGTCVRCQGKGETEIMNPVIPKGFLALPAGMGQKARKRAGLQ